MTLPAPSRSFLIAGNWKMYKTRPEARAFTQGLNDAVRTLDLPLPEIILCPPFTALETVVDTVRETAAPFHVAAQTLASHEEGAYTGEIAPRMLTDIGVTHALVGHSERRQYDNETDQTVNAKVLAALKHGLTPIVCVGEHLAQREVGETDALIVKQVTAAVSGVAAADIPKLVLAYEPVWAIGTGKTCGAGEADRVCGLIRKTLGAETVRVLYGGSVNLENSRELLGMPEIDGALVGGASLQVDSFAQIIASAVEAARPVRA